MTKTKRPLIIFPQGTRVLPDERPQFKKGVSRIYDELKISSFSFGANYEFSPRKHLQAELLLWNDNGEHNLNSSIYDGYLESKNKVSLSYIKFAQPFSRDRYNFKGSLFLLKILILSKFFFIIFS